MRKPNRRASVKPRPVQPHHPWKLTAEWTYLRFHGPRPGHPYQGRYGAKRLTRVAERLATWLDEGVDVYAYLNNDDAGFAVQDALWLSHRLQILTSDPE
jgi:uncharacterized protein YecE (DUF72 family)